MLGSREVIIMENKARIDFRCNGQDKSIIERAASLLGMTVSSFSKASLLERAHEVIQRVQTTSLTKRDSEIFLSLIEKDAQPVESLLIAARRYSEKNSLQNMTALVPDECNLSR